MTQEQFNTLDKLVSATVNNTHLLGQEFKKQYDKSVNIEKNMKLIMDNQVKLFNELLTIKELLLQKPQR
jgi:hypothetical protein